MAFALAPAARAAGHRFVAFDTIDSTQREALARARRGEQGPLWLVAGVQTAGRGRRGSAWQTPRGNLAATLLWTDEPGASLPAAIVATLGFVAGVALMRALREVAPRAAPRPALDGAASEGARFALKWPNDALADGAKLAGILLEREGLDHDGRRGQAVAIGIGVNVAHPAEGVSYPTAALAEFVPGATAEAVFAALSAAWLGAEALWARGQGFPAIRREWLAAAAGLGGPVAARLGSGAGARVVRGTFETIDEGGQIVLRDAEGVAHAIAAGEVHIGFAAAAAPDDAGGRTTNQTTNQTTDPTTNDTTTTEGAAMPAA